MINPGQQFPEMMRRVERVVANAFPIESTGYRLEAKNFRWTDHGPQISDNPRLHKDFKIKDKTLAAKLLADLTVKSADGKTMDTKRGFVLLLLPHVTSRSSYIVNGNEVQIVNQLRLRPGPYARFMADDNTETFINAAGGGFRTIFDRKTNILRIRSGSTYCYLYPVLRALGVSDQEMEHAWGREILEENRRYNRPDEVAKLYRSMRKFTEIPKEPAALATAVDSFFRSKALDPQISRLTLGTEFNQITPQTLLKASEKAINLAGGAVDADDTESLAFKSIHSAEDFIPEKLERAVPGIKAAVARAMQRRPEVTACISPATFSDHVIGWFSSSEFTRYSNQQNPIDVMSTNQLTTTMGEGGIRSMHAVTDQLRVVHPSQMGLLDPLHTPEGGKIGITGHLTLGARKVGNVLALRVYDAKTGSPTQRTAQQIEDKVVAFNDQYDFSKKPPRPVSPQVKARFRGEIRFVPAKDVEYIFADPRTFFSVTTNAIPFLNTNHGNRILMADRHTEQAVALIDPDKPYVQSAYSAGQGYEDFIGKAINPVSPVDGRITKVTRDSIVIRGDDKKSYVVTLHSHYPLNGGSFLTETPVVKPGDRVKKGQNVAFNNFTKDGALAIGKNLRVAYLPYKGYNFEDGTVISESAAQKMTSEHKHEIRLDLTRDIRVGLERWLAHFPDEAQKVDRSKYSVDGIVRKGAVLTSGEVVIPAVEQIIPHEEFDYEKLHKSFRTPWRNKAIYWESDFPGKVIDVVKTSRFIKVFIRTEESMQIGDKLSNRHGAKGIVVNILPDNEMYRDEKGNVIDVLFNPAGIPGRINPGQVFEGVAGKISDKTGKGYLASNFDTRERTNEEIEKAMKASGVKDEETITDPATGEKLNDVFVGNVHFMKLQHQVRKKFNARGIGSYTSDAQPAKVSGESAQNIGSGELFSLLASGATHFLRDATRLKSQSNPEYWRALRLGLPTPPVEQPFILDKFVSYLEGAGINVKRDGTMIKALPMTDKEALLRSKGEIQSPHVVRASDLRPEQGGLFDKKVTGGYGGIHWGHVKLESPIPNPLMERPIISILGLKPAEFNGIMNGRVFVTKDGRLTTDGTKGLPAGEGLRALLSKVDVDAELSKTIAEIRAAKGPSLDALNKRRKFLQALKAAGMRPDEAYIQSVVPVIPPRFRPIYPLPTGALNIADPNHGYREILMINNQLKDLSRLGVDNKGLAPLRAGLYGAVQGMTGMTEPLTRSKNFKGFISTIKGRQNKFGLFQGRVVRRPQDLSGRSTIIPDPKLGIDEVGIPEEMGMEMYKPFIMKRLVTSGFSPIEALDLIDQRDEKAKIALREEMKERPIYLNRAPTLHKFGIMPFKPKAVAGKAIQINPLIVRGFNADFDGDTMGVHVPVSEEARVEAFQKMPSMQLFSTTEDSVMHAPSKEAVLGIYLMTSPVGKPVTAASVNDMLGRFQRGEIKINSAVKVGRQIWTPGQALLDEIFPRDLKPGNKVVDNRALQRMLYGVSKKHPKQAGDIISKVKDLGNHYVTKIGFSVGMKDLKFDYALRDKIMNQAAIRAKRVGFDRAYGEALERLKKAVVSRSDNRFVIGGVLSGAFGKGDQITQMLASPVAVEDHRGKVIPVPITRSFAEGHDISSFWATLPGARKGLADKGLKTADTGALSKKLINTTIEEVVSTADCKTTNGLVFPVDSREALDRVIAEGPFIGKVLDTETARQAKAKGVRHIKVRSPVTCQAVQGVCQKCFGLLENGQFPPVGYHVGVLAGQAISEPLTQLTLRAFHTGGAIGRKAVGFERVKQILEMPENVPGKATISQTTGRVEEVKKSPAGGWVVRVAGMDHFVPIETGLAVKTGDRIRAGQQLSHLGVVKPQDLLAATNNISAVRKRIIDDLDNEFRSGGVKIKRKLFETVVRPMTNRAEVIDAGDGEKHGIYRGDILPLNRIEQTNRDIVRRRGKPIQYNPTLLSIRVAPYHSSDFVGKLMFERPHQTIMAAPGIGATADIRSGHPITQYVFGKHFGEKK